PGEPGCQEAISSGGWSVFSPVDRACFWRPAIHGRPRGRGLRAVGRCGGGGMSQSRIGVVGGGLGGLAAACVLAARGHRVTLFERSAWLGGKAAVLHGDGGYRFDVGPTILTLPSVLRRIFTEAGRDLDDALTLLPCDPQWRSFFGDGTTLDLV